MIVFAGTETKLYQLNNTDYMDRCFKIGRHLYGAVVGCTVAICADGQPGIRDAKNAPLRVFDLSSSTAFADAAWGSPPQAAYIDVVGRFLVLSGLLSAPYRISGRPEQLQAVRNLGPQASIRPTIRIFRTAASFAALPAVNLVTSFRIRRSAA